MLIPYLIVKTLIDKKKTVICFNDNMFEFIGTIDNFTYIENELYLKVKVIKNNSGYEYKNCKENFLYEYGRKIYQRRN